MLIIYGGYGRSIPNRTQGQYGNTGSRPLYFLLATEENGRNQPRTRQSQPDRPIERHNRGQPKTEKPGDSQINNEHIRFSSNVLGWHVCHFPRGGADLLQYPETVAPILPKSSRWTNSYHNFAPKKFLFCCLISQLDAIA